LFASDERVRDDLAWVQCCVPFGAIAEHESFEEYDLNDGTNDKRDVNKNARGRSSTGFGGREDEFGEDDPEADSDEQKGALGN